MKVMVIGLGNTDRGDDGVGPQVADRLRERLPSAVAIAARRGDVLALIDDWAGVDALVCVDAAASLGQPGRVHRLDLATDTLLREAATSSHALGLAEAVALARTLGQAPPHIVVYAVEGACFDGGAPLSTEVAAAVPALVEQVVAEVERLTRAEGARHA